MAFIRFVAQLLAEAFAEIKSSLTMILNDIKDATVVLTNDEKQAIARISELAMELIRETHQLMLENPTLVPSFMQVEHMNTNLIEYDQLDQILHPVEQIHARVNDTMILLRSQMYRDVLAFYQSVQMAAKMDIPGAREVYETMKPRFEKFGRPSTDETPAPETPAENPA